jgi:hypothetical protein
MILIEFTGEKGFNLYFLFAIPVVNRRSNLQFLRWILDRSISSNAECSLYLCQYFSGLIIYIDVYPFILI